MNRRALLKSLALGALAAVLPIRPTRAKAHTFRGVQWDYVPRLDLPGEFVCNWHGREIRIDGATVWMSRVNNPKNWRTHPKAQQDALRGLLAEIGFADALLAREVDGQLQLIDGHLRAETTPDMEVPVLVLDVDEAEADKLLATLDPLAAMAGASADKLQDLLATVATDSEAVASMLARLARGAGLEVPGIEAQEDEAPDPLAKAVTKTGDLWLLGEHRLLCGDSTDLKDVERVLKADSLELQNGNGSNRSNENDVASGPTVRAGKQR